MGHLADGWGGTITQTVRRALTDGNAVGLADRQSLVGEKLQKSGEYTVLAAGVEYEEGEDAPLTFDSSLLILREHCAVTVCVQDGENAAPLNVMGIVQRALRAIIRDGWLDPRVEFGDVAYADEAEKTLLAQTVFRVSGRASASLNIRGEI